MHAMKSKSVFMFCAIMLGLSLASAAGAQTQTLLPGQIACTPNHPTNVSAGSFVSITGTAVDSSDGVTPATVRFAIWAGATKDDLNVRIFKMEASSLTSQQGNVQVPFITNGDVWLQACMNNISSVQVDYTLDLGFPVFPQ
jgi:hypothetical protein